VQRLMPPITISRLGVAGCARGRGAAPLTQCPPPCCHSQVALLHWTSCPRFHASILALWLLGVKEDCQGVSTLEDILGTPCMAAVAVASYLAACSLPFASPLVTLEASGLRAPWSPCPRTPAGNCGLSADLALPASPEDAAYGAHATLFAEELGLVLEVKASEAQDIAAQYQQAGVSAAVIGKVRSSNAVRPSSSSTLSTLPGLQGAACVVLPP